jgi:DNA-binding NarL/FixJ family response regulator
MNKQAGSNGGVGPSAGRVLIADHDECDRRSLGELLTRAGYEIRETATGAAALDAAREERPALVVLEVSLPDVSGYTVCWELRGEFGAALPIIFLSGDRTESYDRMAGLLIGADDYLAKPWAADELLLRVQRLIGRAAPAAPAIASGLTAREREVLQLLAQGLSKKEIARQLYLSPKTVNSHAERLYEKLSVHSKSEAVAVAFRRGLVDPAPRAARPEVQGGPTNSSRLPHGSTV